MKYSLVHSNKVIKKNGVGMYLNDLDNAYIYACKRRNDEMREAAQSHLMRELHGNGKSSSWLAAVLGVLALLLAIFKIF